MKTAKVFPALALLFLAGLVSSCATGSSSASTQPESAGSSLSHIPELKDGDYVLVVEMKLASTEGLKIPSDPIPLSNYEPAPPGERLSVRISDGGRKVRVLSKISGVLERSKGKTRVYDLTEGLFAGGRLLVEETPKGLVASYTIFGSGEPVLSSRRGPLVSSSATASSDASTQPEAVASSFSLNDGDYVLAVERVLASTEGVKFPSDPIPLSYYEPTPPGERLSAKPGERLPIKISDGGRKVELMSAKVSGTLEKSNESTRLYDLTQGLSAGGRLLVEETPQGLVASYTIWFGPSRSFQQTGSVGFSRKKITLLF